MRSKTVYLSGGPVSGQKRMISEDVFEVLVYIKDTDSGHTKVHRYIPPMNNRDSLVYTYTGVIQTISTFTN